MSVSGTNLEEHIIFQRETASSNKNLNFESQGTSDIVIYEDTSVSSFISDNIVLRSLTSTATKKFIFLCTRIVFEEMVKKGLNFMIKHREDILHVFQNLKL